MLDLVVKPQGIRREKSAFQKRYDMEIEAFKKIIYDFYRSNKRDFVWRKDIAPYKIFVSEIMLQQTQTLRVELKFIAWLEKFPNFQTLAKASTQEVLTAWQGLGYNRRALALHEGAKKIVSEFDGQVPSNLEVLQTFKGIGPNTAASICAFAFNLPVVFIETNIRTVFLHCFFPETKEKIHDKELLPLIAATLDHENSRDWYYALMDYGVHIKKELKANNKMSKHYTRQSKFVGSKRQVRGAIVRILSKGLSLSHDELHEMVSCQLPENMHDVARVVQSLVAEGFVKEKDGFLKV